MKAFVFTAAIIALSPLAALAQSDPAKERNVLMRGIQDNGYNPLRAMAQGKQPYDKAAVEQSYAVIQGGLEKAAGLWPANTPSHPDSRFASSPKVWENKADFDAKFAEAKKVAASSKTLAVSGQDGVAAAVKQLDVACGSCHETYRVRQR